MQISGGRFDGGDRGGERAQFHLSVLDVPGDCRPVPRGGVDRADRPDRVGELHPAGFGVFVDEQNPATAVRGFERLISVTGPPPPLGFGDSCGQAVRGHYEQEWL
ncbi:hypothetical protein [Nocardia carnea]|uniref:hypothetical protein n=1 Tax=Nocardia carnea TaxID=37328 RepID=UPI0024569689|nr:hypothetical protein [Nocardia carnea]